MYCLLLSSNRREEERKEEWKEGRKKERKEERKEGRCFFCKKCHLIVKKKTPSTSHSRPGFDIYLIKVLCNDDTWMGVGGNNKGLPCCFDGHVGVGSGISV
jgi:hypothetical protein